MHTHTHNLFLSVCHCVRNAGVVSVSLPPFLGQSLSLSLEVLIFKNMCISPFCSSDRSVAVIFEKKCFFFNCHKCTDDPTKKGGD